MGLVLTSHLQSTVSGQQPTGMVILFTSLLKERDGCNLLVIKKQAYTAA